MIKKPLILATVIGTIYSVVFTISASKKTPQSDKKSYADYYCAYANEIQFETIKELETTYNVQCCGVGGGMPYFINDLQLNFNVDQPCSISTARNLIVHMKENFLQHINNHKKARSYLVSYPFPYENASISLTFENKNGKQYLGTAINHVIAGGEKICYSFLDYKKYFSKIVYEESYEDAYKIVMGIPRPENLNPGPRKQIPKLNPDGSDAIPAILNNDPNNPWPEKPS